MAGWHESTEALVTVGWVWCHRALRSPGRFSYQKYLHKNKGPGLCHICRTPLSGQLEPLHAAVTALMKSKSELGFNFNNIPKNPALEAGGLPGADCSLACWEHSRSQAAPLGPETLVLPLSQPCRPKGCLSPSLLATAPLSSGGAGSQRRSGRI